MASEVVVTADKIKKRKKRTKITKISLIVLFVILIVSYFILKVIYNGGRFTISLDNNNGGESGIMLHETLNNNDGKTKLYAEELEYMDNISIDWLPKNINEESDGSHNGENYIAYTFYITNEGKETLNYWYEIIVDDVVKNVDEAVRVMIIQNGQRTVYAKANLETGKPEEGTTMFTKRANSKKNSIILEQRKAFSPKDVDKYTIVIWLEGDDDQCVNNIIGGEIKMHMDIREEHIQQGGA